MGRPKPRATGPTDPRVPAILEELRNLGSERNREGMARYGINTARAYGVSVVVLRQVARRYRRQHDLARSLWATGVHEARLLACFVEDPQAITEAQLDQWVLDFDSWDLCDQATAVFDRTPWAWDRAVRWATREEEFVKRAAFSLIAALATHDKTASDAAFRRLFPVIQAGAFDARNFVKKAVSWALRGVGKRNQTLHTFAIRCAEGLLLEANRQAGGARGGPPEVRAARWVAQDSLRELTAEKTALRLAERAARRRARGSTGPARG